MQFRVLGDLEVVEGGKPLPLGGRKQRALLAALLLDANHVVQDDVLVEALWGEEASAKAPANLHSLVSRLRRTLGAERIERHAGGYLLRVEESDIDVHHFERLRAEARLLPPAAASERLRLAFDLWRGPPLADFTYDSWAVGEIQRLEELRIAATEERVEADLEAGKHKELIAELQNLVSEHPLREGFRRLLIVALYRSGRQAEALEAYQAARKMLDEELGLQPSPALRELEGAVLRHDPALDAPSGATPPVALVPVNSNRRRRVALLVASVLLAFGAAALSIWWPDRDDARHTEAVAAPTPSPRSTVDQPVARRQERSKSNPKVAARAASQPTTARPTRPRRSALPRSSPPAATTRPAERPKLRPVPPPPPPPARRRPPPPPPPPPSKPVPVRLSDNFDDGVMSRELWTSWAHGTGAEAVERNGRLEMTIPADAVPGGEWNMVAVAWGTTCRLLGDFDVRVEYELLDWPRANGARIELAAFFTSNALTVARTSQRGGESYAASYRTSGAFIETTDVRGALRIRRRKDATIAYHRVGSEWAAVRGFVTDRAPNIGLQFMSVANDFAHERVRIALDNFEVTASQPVC